MTDKKRIRNIFIAGCGLASMIFTGCVTTENPSLKAAGDAQLIHEIISVSQKISVPRPNVKMAVVNFSRMLEGQKDISDGVPPRRDSKTLMHRVLLSPNLVFESSRSSAMEAQSFGASDETLEGAPEKKYAVGSHVQSNLSAALMRYLRRKGSMLIAPAILRSFNQDYCSVPDSCPHLSWVERLLLSRQVAQNTNKSPTGTMDNQGKPGLSPDYLPTAALAVRHLSVSLIPVELVIVKDEIGTLLVQPQTFMEENSLCDKMVLGVPSLYFSAEIISAIDGQVIARIDRKKIPKLQQNLNHSILTQGWEPQHETAYVKYRVTLRDGVEVKRTPIVSSSYQYVTRWVPKDRSCKNIQEAYFKVREETTKQFDLYQLAQDLFQETLDPLYQ
ncbi:MAG: hypothetical protein HQM14_13690 [SAR324 cluster bacterium]|nr:hypothetical protein [SAR324 cluster bacterium]